MRGEEFGKLFVLVVLFALLSAILYVMVGFWTECGVETAYMRERVDWPTTTVEATLVDVSLRSRRADRLPNIIGRYTYEFGGTQHEAEVYENSSGSREDREEAARRLREAGKTIDLEVQYSPNDSSVVSDDIVTYVTSCRWWIGGFFLFFVLLWLLVLKGFSRLRFR